MMTIHFSRTELECPCCHACEMNPIVLEKIERVRNHMGIPLYINSAFRCIKHNEDVGGAATSQHLLGNALDVSTTRMTGCQKLILLKAALLEFSGIGIGKTYIHMDVRENKTLWVY